MEAGASVLSVLLHPAFLGAVAVGALLLAMAATSQIGAQPPAGVPRASIGTGLDPQSVLALARTDPLGVVARLILPAIIQAILFGMLLTVLVLLWRRRRTGDPAARRELSA